MKQEKFWLEGAGGRKLPAVIWLPEQPYRLVLQITHGMTEHMGRYEALAEKLAEDGIVTAGFDLRGHGANPGDPDCASFGENGWEASLEDMDRFRKLLDERFADLPLVMMGFSLGSFLLRDYLNRYENPAGALILGTSSQPGPVLRVLKCIIRSQIRRAGFDRTTPLVRQLSFETYNKQFAPNRTESDWLCADIQELDAYRQDTLCRKSISAGLFWQLLDGMQRTGSKTAYNGWDKEMPVCLISGAEDPVGGRGRGVLHTEKQMKRAGMSRVQLTLLPGARHDVLHETDSGSAAQAIQLMRHFLQQRSVCSR